MKLIWILFTGCLLLATLPEAQCQDLNRYPLIPWPQYIEAREGTFTLDSLTQITLSDPTDDDLHAVAAFWADRVRLSSGLPLPIAEAPARGAARGTVAFVLDAGTGTGDEGYRLDVSPESVTITAATAAGLFYGVQTLRQLLPIGVERGGVVRGNDATLWTIPAVEIEDAPRFGYRGMHLDAGRHFFPVSFIKKYLNLMVLYKFNRFHWHLTEDQGWRIEIKQYPKLTEVGAYRNETLIGHYDNVPHRYDGERYGGFYTQDEVRRIVAYARGRRLRAGTAHHCHPRDRTAGPLARSALGVS